MTKKEKKFITYKSKKLWDKSLTIRENALNLGVGLGCAYTFAYRHGLRFKHDYKAGQKYLDQAVDRDGSDSAEKQRFLWDERCILI